MMDDSRADRQERERVGLCASCRHARIVENDRGSRFYMCRLSLTDGRFRRYPPLPVRACIGYEGHERPPQDAG